jgi:PAS domain S-box-containing protein
MQDFFELSPDLLCILRLDGTLQQANAAFVKLLGYDRTTLSDQPILRFVHPDDQAETQTILTRLVAERLALEFEQRFRAQDGTWKWLAWNLAYVSVSGFIFASAREVTQRKQAEAIAHSLQNDSELRVAERTAELVSLNYRLQQELNDRREIEAALRISQTRFSGILEIADDAIISVNTRQCITLFNQGAEKIFGYTAEEILGQPLDLLLPMKAIAAHRHYVAEFGQTTSQARKMGERRPIFGRRKDGSEFPAEASISCLDLGGEKVFTVILRDVTDRLQVERMKDEFISVVSHELRTPLTSIHGSLGMLASGLLSADSDRGKRLLQIAVESTDRLVRLINDILDIERIESGKVAMAKQTCNAAKLVKHAIEVMQPIATKTGITLSVNTINVSLLADPDRIVQTLTNLLSNAIKFSPSGSMIYINTKLIENDSTGKEALAHPTLLFTIQDQGRGIPSDKLDKIFERFQQVDASDSRNHEGTGLGLAICRSIVQQHGGQIWVNSKLGEGSTFYFTLPILLERVEADDKAHSGH